MNLWIRGPRIRGTLCNGPLFLALGFDRPVSVAVPDEEEGGLRRVLLCCKKAGRWFCGLEDSKAPELSKEEEAALQQKLTDTEENPFWKRVVNTNGIILLAVAVFCHGFFA